MKVWTIWEWSYDLQDYRLYEIYDNRLAAEMAIAAYRKTAGPAMDWRLTPWEVKHG